MIPYLLSYNLGRTLIIVGRFKWRGKYTRGCFWTNLREAETDGRNIATSSKVPSCQLLTFWNSISPIQFSNQISQFRHFAVGWEQRARLFPFFFSLSIFDTTSIPFFYKVKKKLLPYQASTPLFPLEILSAYENEPRTQHYGQQMSLPQTWLWQLKRK